MPVIRSTIPPILVTTLLASSVPVAGAVQSSSVFKPNTVYDAGRVPQPPPSGVPPHAIGRSGDNRAYVETIDGRRSGFVFTRDGELVIRGKGLGRPVAAFIYTSRNVYRPGPIPRAGSLLKVLRASDDELVVRVTGVSAGSVPWSRSGSGQGRHYTLEIRLDGGARVLRGMLRDATYRCVVGEPNCAT